MQPRSPKQMDAAPAAEALKQALSGKGRDSTGSGGLGGSRPPHLNDFTIADAAAKSGLPLRDAETGLHALVSEYRGHLRVTNDGDLLFRFPNGFTKPWETRTRLAAFADRAGRALLGVGRFVVRAWISVVLVAYALIFLALLLAMVFARSSGDSRSSSRGGGAGLEIGYVFFRVVADALFWTFHPFSPFAYRSYGYGYAGPAAYARREQRRKKDETPFYDKVNRFFFGPDVPPPDPRAMEKRILAEIRAEKGRIGLADVIRVTGLPRDEADPLMSRLMLDYDGTVEVSEEGGIVYRFESLRRTVEEGGREERPEPVWTKLKRLVPLTGNEPGTNVMIAALNGFNLLMSYWAIQEHFTFEKLSWLFDRAQQHVPHGLPLVEPAFGTAIALGYVPFFFSLALFLLPMARSAFRPIKERRVARENGRRGMLRAILGREGKDEVTDETLRAAWKEAAGADPDPKEITREVVALGGDAEIADDGHVRYRFPDFEAEAKALEAEREAASDAEAHVGPVVFSSEE